MCAKFRFSITLRCDDIIGYVKGEQQYAPPPAAGGWRGGPAALGLSTFGVRVEKDVKEKIDKNIGTTLIKWVGGGVVTDSVTGTERAV